MAIRTEISLKLQNSPGALGRVCEHLADERVNILGLNLETGGTLRLVVDNPLHAVGILEEQRYAVDQCEVLFIQLPNDPGALEKTVGLLANAGVNLNYIYGVTLEDDPMAALVVGVEDAQRASMSAGV